MAPSEAPNSLATLKRWATAVAMVGILAALLGRGIAPALAGAFVGIDRAVVWVERVAGVATQLFALGTTVLGVALMTALGRGPLSLALRVPAIAAGLAASMAVMSASATRIPLWLSVALGGVASVVAVAIAFACMRTARVRAAAVSLAALGVACALRVAAIAMTAFVLDDARASVPVRSMPWMEAARGLATVAQGFEFVALGAVLDWFTGRSRRGVRVAVGIAMVGLAAASMAVARSGARPDAGAFSVLFGRSIERLLAVPAPFAPELLRVFGETLAWLLAGLGLCHASRRALTPAAVTLALIARGSIEAPLGVACLMAAAFCLALERGADLTRADHLRVLLARRPATTRSSAPGRPPGWA